MSNKNKNKSIYLILMYLLTRLFFVFALVPFLSLFWRKKSHGDVNMPSDTNYFTYCLKLLSSADALNFQEIITNGYNHEKAHGFYPGYPMSLVLLRIPFGNAVSLEVLAFL